MRQLSSGFFGTDRSGLMGAGRVPCAHSRGGCHVGVELVPRLGGPVRLCVLVDQGRPRPGVSDPGHGPFAVTPGRRRSPPNPARNTRARKRGVIVAASCKMFFASTIGRSGARCNSRSTNLARVPADPQVRDGRAERYFRPEAPLVPVGEVRFDEVTRRAVPLVAVVRTPLRHPFEPGSLIFGLAMTRPEVFWRRHRDACLPTWRRPPRRRRGSCRSRLATGLRWGLAR